jgi:hypothetical protein
MKGVKVKIPEVKWDIRWEINMLLYGCVCLGIGVLLGIQVLTLQQNKDILKQAKAMEAQVEAMQKVVDQYVNDRDTVIRSFREIESRLTRHELLMRVPRSERRETWKELEEEQ